MHDLSLQLAPGHCLLVLGANGTGKSTLLKLLAGLIRPHQGTVQVAGRLLRADDPASRAALGLVAHQTMLYDDLTLLENLEFAARLYGQPGGTGLAMAALEAAGLADRARDRPRDLSRGMQQRAAIARALLHQPTVILLDEAFTGLDASSAERLRARLLAEQSRGCAIVVVSHQPSEAWPVATHVGVLAEGRWARFEARPAELGIVDGWLRQPTRG
ncbi:MAG: ABC transporter ATP-binding protein [Gemmatimonadota bacterium]